MPPRVVPGDERLELLAREQRDAAHGAGGGLEVATVHGGPEG
ncbi:MAG: hypothetical protein ABI629_07960 [bacterium]